jgi:TRAP-type mannitol/chloroaromatic compound transport system permease small subunit
MNALAASVRFVDRLNDLVGRGASWLTLAMVFVTFAVVVFRYGFSLGWVWLQEAYVWLYALVFMLGAGYTLLHDGHVRVDIFYRPASIRFQAIVDLCGSIFLLLPMIVTVAWASVPYVVSSWEQLEGSREAGGLEGLFLLKSVLLVFCLLVGLQGLAMAGRSVLILTGHPEFMPPAEEPEHMS